MKDKTVKIWLVMMTMALPIWVFIFKTWAWKSECTIVKAVKIVMTIIIIICSFWEFKIISLFRDLLNKSAKVIESSEISSESSTIFLAIVIPLFSISISSFWEWMSYLILIILIWVYISKSNMYLYNPFLVILGYHYYKVILENEEEIYVLTRNKIEKNKIIYLRNIERNHFIGENHE